MATTNKIVYATWVYFSILYFHHCLTIFIVSYYAWVGRYMYMICQCLSYNIQLINQSSHMHARAHTRTTALTHTRTHTPTHPPTRTRTHTHAFHISNNFKEGGSNMFL